MISHSCRLLSLRYRRASQLRLQHPRSRRSTVNWPPLFPSLFARSLHTMSTNSSLICNTARDAQRAELTDHLHVIEDELLDLSDMLHRRVAEVHVHIPECHGNLTVPHLRIIFSLTSWVVRDSTTSGSPTLPVSTPWKLQHLDSRDPTDGWPLSSSTSTLSAMKEIPASPRANQMRSLWG